VGRRAVALAAVVASLAVGACGPEPTAASSSALRDEAVTVASFDFSESELLAELYAQAIEASGIRVERELRVGPRELTLPALQRGLVELVPEYAGSLLEWLAGEGTAASDVEAVRRALDPELSGRGLEALASAPAQNRNVFAVTASTSSRFGLSSISDLAAVPSLRLGGPPECPSRPLCLPGLEATYGLDVATFVPVDAGGPLAVEALVRDVVDVALLFSTSPAVRQHGFVVLEDDRALQPAEPVTPIVHADALARFGQGLVAAVDAVSASLTTRELRSLNARVELEGTAPAVAAHRWLVDQRIVAPGS
jgi:osmoprotectant transport system substrate-binding protein